MSVKLELKAMQKISVQLAAAFNNINMLCNKYFTHSDRYGRDNENQIMTIEPAGKDARLHQKQKKYRFEPPPAKQNQVKEVKQIKPIEQQKLKKHNKKDRQNQSDGGSVKSDRKNEKKKKLNKNGKQQKNKQIILQRPKQPLSPFFLFMTKNRDKIIHTHPELNGKQVSDTMEQVWRNMTQPQRKQYVDQFEKNKAEYENKMKVYYRQHPEEKKKKGKQSSTKEKIDDDLQSKKDALSNKGQERLKARVEALKNGKNKLLAKQTTVKPGQDLFQESDQ